MRPSFLILAIALVCVAVMFVPMAQAGNCGVEVNSFGVQSFGFQQPVFVNSFGVHPQFQSRGFVGVSAVPIQSFAAPVFVNAGFNRAAVNVNVNQRRSFFRSNRTNVNVNRFGGVNVNVR